ncbi:MAG: histidine kinase [Melioribacteraceae bacterium]|nr:histidine kinase [Melioribacteraceae bacterium]MCF8264785.1 histidine kinase [Melioribacteraceae bacterium]MCF8413958.1 histidine kinase [Melioribacteraceae bacterium]
MNIVNSTKKYYVGYSIVWSVIFFAHAIVLFTGFGLSLSISLKDALISNGLYFILGLSLWYPTKFLVFEKSTTFKVVTNHSAAAIVSTLIWVFSTTYLVNTWSNDNAEFEKFLRGSIPWRMGLGLIYYTILVTINYLLIYYQNFHETLTKESKLNALVKETELKTLKYQINPHFIFNSLNSISSLTMLDPKKAQTMTIKLSEYLRSTLSSNEKQMIYFRDEINNIRNYLAIEKVRFEDKFEFVEKVNAECSEIKVPSMILQPLFENAIKFGVYEATEKILLELSCEQTNNFLKIVVKNEFDESIQNKKGEGIGLTNIRNRLSLIYGRDDLFKTESKEQIFTATIYIPLFSS